MEFQNTKMSENINEDEAALYDRQIRLWGLEAQNRLKNSSVLLVGLSGLGAEIAKNLMLAGLKNLTLMDDILVSEADQSSQFLSPTDSVDQNRAEASLSRCQILNPMVNVKVEKCNLTSKDNEYFTNFDLVCLVNQSQDQMDRVDKICREKNVRFCSGGVFGWFGFGFADFLDLEFADEAKKSQSDDKGTEVLLDAPPEKISKLNGGNGDTMDAWDTDVTKSEICFPSFHDSFYADWSAKGISARTKKNVPPGYYVIKALLNFWSKHGSLPSEIKEIDVIDDIDQIWNDLLAVSKRDPDSIPTKPEEFLPFCHNQLSPVCAIVGGIMAQEIIKALSQKDRPLNNLFIYNGLDTSGIVIQLPPPKM